MLLDFLGRLLEKIEEPPKINRRYFIIGAGIAASSSLIVPKNLIGWNFSGPAQKKFYLSDSEIISREIERIRPKLKTLFEQDDFFYQRIAEGVSDRGIRLATYGDLKRDDSYKRTIK